MTRKKTTSTGTPGKRKSKQDEPVTRTTNETQQPKEESPTSDPVSSETENVENTGASSVQAQPEQEETKKPPRPPREFIMAIEGENLRMFRKAVTSLGLMAEEAKFHVTGDGIRFTGMDPSHVSLIDFSWKHEACKEYVADSEFDLTLKLEDLLRRLPKDFGASVTITQNPELSKKEIVSIRKTLGGRTTAFEISELDSQQTKQPLPKLGMQVRAILNADLLLQILDDVAQVANKVTLIANSDGLELFDKGDSGPVSTTLSRGSPEMISLDFQHDQSSKPISPPIVARYPLEYLVKILKALKADHIVLEYSSKAPLRIRYELPSNSYLDFLLAPVVQEVEGRSKADSSQQPTEAAVEEKAECGQEEEGSENDDSGEETTDDQPEG